MVEQVPLVCCLLFTCIEFLKGNNESSMLHAQSGFSILSALRRSRDATPDLGPNISSNDLKAIDDHIIPMYSRLSVLCSVAYRIPPRVFDPKAREDSPQENFTDSRRRFFVISDTCIRFIRNTRVKAVVFQVDIEDLIEQVKLQTRLDTWRHQLDGLLERMQAAGNPVRQDALNLLLVQYKVIYIWLRVCATPGEMATDAYQADFEELVHYAEQVAKPGTGMATPQPLSFEVHILGPLYYATMKCRNPSIRRRALEMLQFAPRREGLWNAHHAYAMAKRVIELEEMHLHGQELPDEKARVHHLPLPDETSRVYNRRQMHLDSWKFDHSIVPSPAFPATLKAEFRTKPWGIMGEWQVITEYLKI